MSCTTTSSKPKKARFYYVLAEDLESVLREGIDYEKGEHPLNDQPVVPGDDVLVALRKIFSLTYPLYDPLPDLKNQAEQMRDLAVKALLELGDHLKALRLPPVNSDKERPGSGVFKYLLVPTKMLSKMVPDPETAENRHRIDLIEADPADASIVCLRRILKLTFSEAHNDNDYIRVFAKIRKMAAEVLVPSNCILENIEVEPVAMPILWGEEFIDEDPIDPEEFVRRLRP